MAENEDNSDVSIGHHIVLLVDVLNQRDAIRRLEKLPASDGERAEYIAAIKQSAGSVIGVRKQLETFFSSFLGNRPSAMTQSLSPEQRAIYDNYRDFKLRTQMFSDTVIVYSPLVNSFGSLSMSGVYALLFAAGTTVLTSLAAKVSIRGGVDIGVALELGDRDLYGPAFANAYALESTVAQYPRIVVGKGVVKYLNETARTVDTPLEQLNAEMASICMETITQDVDGAYFIDFLGQGFRKLARESVTRELAEKADVFVRGEHTRFANQGDHKLALRYGCLRQYIETRLDQWK